MSNTENLKFHLLIDNSKMESEGESYEDIQDCVEFDGHKRTKRTLWTEEEEKSFLEGLELYGRDWKKCAKHIKTKNIRSVSSKAQQYFLSLYKNNLPLPLKVKESGEGYTLSGRPLEINGSTARAYGLAGIDGQKQYREELRNRKKRRRIQEIECDDKSDDGLPSKTYQFRQKRPTFKNYQTDFELCRLYDPFDSNTPNTQPFRVIFSADALFITDFHSHLSLDEILGYLAGTWDESTRTLHIIMAYPGVSVSSNSHIRCEMDPLSEINIRETVSKANLSIIGWYHSHPKFPPNPSACDVTNQSNIQDLYRNDSNILIPFIGMIISPYDLNLSDEHSLSSCFIVDTKSSQLTPYILSVEYSSSVHADILSQLGEIFGGINHSIDLNAVWRNRIKFGDKIKKALIKYFPNNNSLFESTVMKFIHSKISLVDEKQTTNIYLHSNLTKQSNNNYKSTKTGNFKPKEYYQSPKTGNKLSKIENKSSKVKMSTKKESYRHRQTSNYSIQSPILDNILQVGGKSQKSKTKSRKFEEVQVINKTEKITDTILSVDADRVSDEDEILVIGNNISLCHQVHKFVNKPTEFDHNLFNNMNNPIILRNIPSEDETHKVDDKSS